jgi:beta-ribofuranosylaminobenzene 5'-phosphate synthase
LIVETPSRIHLALIDLNGSLGRIDGGVGLTLEKPRLVVEMEPGDRGIEVEFNQSHVLPQNVMNDYSVKIKALAGQMINHFQLEDGFRFKVLETYPHHSGLGSGTQLSLAVGKLISQINDLNIEAVEIAKIVGRGGTSGIGVASFDNGGFIVDGGHLKDDKPNFLPSSASDAIPPPIIVRYDFPLDWKVILVIPNLEKGVHGDKEINIFQEYCPIPLGEVQSLSHLLLMKMMPAVVEKDLDAFGEAVNSIQNIGFKKIENQLQNPLIGEIMQLLRDAGAPGVGMSSFGPTIYAVTDHDRYILNTAQDALQDVGGQIIETKAQNDGAYIK